LLLAAGKSGSECLRDASSELFSLAISGVYTGAPGEPAPRHVQDKAGAERRVQKFAADEPVRDFYRSLVAHAEGSIRVDIALLGEEDEE